MGIRLLLSRLWIPVSIGLLAGLTHSLVETGLVRWLGVSLTPFDWLVQALFFGLGGAGGTAAAVAALAMIRPKLLTAQDDWIRLSFLVAVLGYAVVFVKIVGDHRESLAQAGAWGLPGLLVIAFALLGPQGRRGRFCWAAASLVAVSAAFCGAQLLEIELSRVPESNRAGLIMAVVGAMAAVAAVAWAWIFVVAKPRFPGAALVPQLALAGAMAAAMLFAHPGYGWRTVRRLPALTQTPPPGNFVLIVLDTVRADHLDLFGYPRETMPLLKARAERGDFELVRKIHANSSWTPASHGSMFTGLFPWQHGAHRGRFNQKQLPQRVSPLRTDVDTIAETMSDLGYATGGVSGNFGYMSGYNFDQGFSHYDSIPGPPFLARDMLWLYQINHDTDKIKPGLLLYGRMPTSLARRTTAFDRFRPMARRAEEVRLEALRWLEKNQQRPFFLFMNFIDAHTPYLPVEQDDGIFVEAPSGVGPETWDEDFAAVKTGAKVPPERLEYYMGQYNAEFRDMDRVLDGFLNELERRGLTDDTLLFITSDHGESFMEHGHLVHGETLYENQISVPLLVKLPKSRASEPLEVGPAMQHVDFLPTAATMLGFEPPAGIAGTAWGRGREHALSEVYCCLTEWRLPGDLAAVVVGDEKLIVSSTGEKEAYNLKADPHEKRMLDEAPPTLDKTTMEVLGGRRYDADGDLTGEETPEMRDKLKSLGYIN